MTPSKMFSRAFSRTRRTLPTSTPSAERTGVPRRSALYEIAWPSSNSIQPRANHSELNDARRGKASAPLRRISPMVVVLGIDPGTAHTGYGVVLSRGRTLAALDGGVIATGPSEPLERRLARIHARICDLISEHRPDALAIEELFFGQNVRTAFAVGQARGVVLLSAGMTG